MSKIINATTEAMSNETLVNACATMHAQSRLLPLVLPVGSAEVRCPFFLGIKEQWTSIVLRDGC